MLRNFNGNRKHVDVLLKKREFILGYESIRRGTPFDYSTTSGSYERGRQLAILTRQVIGYAPPMPASIELVRPIYINARLSQTISGTQHNFWPLADDSGRQLCPQKYAKAFFKTPAASSNSFDSILGL